MTRALALCLTTLALAARAPGQDRVAFDVASIKPLSNPDPRRDYRFPSFLPGGRFQATGPLYGLLTIAYNFPFNPGPRVSASDDVMRELVGSVYAIDATGSFPAGLSGSALRDRQRLMVQTLLADRFKLVTHRVTKEMPVYELVVAKGGPKLQKAEITEKDCADPFPNQIPCHEFNGGQGRGLHARAADMPDLVRFVENWTQRPLIDKTGINGLYRFETSGWTQIQAGPTPAAGAKAEDGRDLADVPTIFQVFAGMGLRMESQKAGVEVLIIDHVEKPSEN